MISVVMNGEDGAYAQARRALLEAEIALQKQREAVARLRRDLPMGHRVACDYVFQEAVDGAAGTGDGRVCDVTLSALFEPGTSSLIVVHYMFGAGQTDPCPMCTMWADGYDAVVDHVRQRTGMVLVARAGADKLRALARRRGWRRLRLLSSAANTFNADYKVETAPDEQFPGVSVFQRDDDGVIRHFYTAQALMAEGVYRGIDLMSPVWHLYDLLPQGRGAWWPRLSYGDDPAAPSPAVTD